MNISVSLCADDPSQVICPRCHRWHSGPLNTPYPVDALVAKGYDPARQKICDRCEAILLSDYPDHEASLAIRLNRERPKMGSAPDAPPPPCRL